MKKRTLLSDAIVLFLLLQLVFLYSFFEVTTTNIQRPIILLRNNETATNNFQVPSKTVSNEEGEFSYITSYNWNRETRILYIVALGKNFFLKNKTLNMAFTTSFTPKKLRHPFILFPKATWGDTQGNCRRVKTYTVDVLMKERTQVMKCHFPNTPIVPATTIKLCSLYSKFCLQLDITRNGGRLSEYTTRRFEVKTKPTISICIGGLLNYTPYLYEIISNQIHMLGAAHIYLGLNSDDLDLRGQYQEALKEYIHQRRVSVIPAPAPRTDVVFTQGKLPFLNECLYHAKSYGDEFLGIWDLDEMLLFRNSNYWGRLAEYLLLSTSMNSSNFLNSYCFVDLSASSFVQQSRATTNSSLPLALQFPFETRESCGNYSKSIVVVPRVDFVGIHLPESCDLYGRGKIKQASLVASNIVYKTDELLLAHFVQLWDPQRYSLCEINNKEKNIYSKEIFPSLLSKLRENNKE